MQLHNVSEKSSVLNTFIRELRDVNTQTDRMRFRKNIERIGEIMAYEMSKAFTYVDELTKTPLGTKTIPIHQENIVICSVLRAGIPLHNGLLNYFDMADNAFISAFRHHKENPEDFEIVVEYLASPSIEGKTLILADPMLATGKSLVSTFEALKPLGKPKHIHLVSVIGAKNGIEFISKFFPENCDLWIAAIDDFLDSYGYIVPGLGDAGDLSFGEKLQH
jgi:uracil phosphoribosyltransferase